MCYSRRDGRIEEEALRLAQERSEDRKRSEARVKKPKKESVADKVRELVRV
ncbi:MAG: hypothetical protein ACRDTR_00925 [Rubrobacter sp.]